MASCCEARILTPGFCISTSVKRRRVAGRSCHRHGEGLSRASNTETFRRPATTCRWPSTRVRYIGEEVAAVAAIDEDTAEEALDLIEVEYEPLPAVFDPEEAMQPGAPQLHDHAAGNISGHSAFHFGDVEEGFAAADYIREDVFETQPVKHGMLEPHACVGLWDNSGKITLWACKMSPYVVWRQLAMGLGVEPGKIRVMQTFVGGGFSGGKQEAMPMDFCAVMLVEKDRAAGEVRPHHGRGPDHRPHAPSDEDLAADRSQRRTARYWRSTAS